MQYGIKGLVAGSLFMIVIFMAKLPVVEADTISISQVITVTATVQPARSIVVNDQGQMTKIYSNTSENVTPKVYLHEAPGQELPLTSALQTKYNTIMAKPGNKVGVAINVPIPAQPPLDHRLSKLLSTTFSMAIKLPNF